MKKEGTGKPRSPEIEIDASVRVSELHFERVPESEVCFRGNTKRNSVWGGRRENLPDEVQEGVVYNDAGARLRIASEIVDSDSSLSTVSSKERTGSKTSNRKAKTPQRGRRSEQE